MSTLWISIPLVLIGAVLVVWGGSPAVAQIVAPYADQLDEEPGLVRGGQIIGMAERLLIYVFVLAGAPSAIGVLVTAKPLFRFGDVTGKQQRRHAEYIIIGPLASFAYAVTLSYLVRWVLTVLV
ncbi:hypothetical protein [Salinibacter sp.]|uniref:hypothetical protein n=1 Tax=Salinibacter sp. TaxID=2065818 RepID=UPI0021E8ACAE|nr:hypothetical protein [Salinibacter sp.]